MDHKSGAIQCYIVPVGDSPNQDVFYDFVEEVLKNADIAQLYETYASPYIEQVSRYGAKITNDSPPILEGNYHVFPLAAIAKVLMFLQEIEKNSCFYTFPEEEKEEPVAIHLRVPKTDKTMTVSVSITVAIAVNGPENPCMACQSGKCADSQDIEFSQNNMRSPALMASLHMIHLEQDDGKNYRNAINSKGISSFRTKYLVKFNTNRVV